MITRIRSAQIDNAALNLAVSVTLDDWEVNGIDDPYRCKSLSVGTFASKNPLKAEIRIAKDWAVASLYEVLTGIDYADRTGPVSIESDLWQRWWEEMHVRCLFRTPEAQGSVPSHVSTGAERSTALDMILADD